MSMQYLLNNLFIDIDVDYTDFDKFIYFKVQNGQLDTFWIVEHTIIEVQELAMAINFRTIPQEFDKRILWGQELCAQLIVKQELELVSNFVKPRPRRLHKQPKNRSYSTFNLLTHFPPEEIRLKCRQTLSQRQKEYLQITPDYEVHFSLLQSMGDFERFLKSLNYKSIRLVGQGAQTHTFKAISENEQLVAVRISYNSPEAIQAALLQKRLNQDVVDNLCGQTIFQYQVLEVGDILVVEEELATQSLEDMLMKRYGERIPDSEINQILYELVQQLYNLHMIRQSVHNDIKPENILLQDGRYILHDYGAVQKLDTSNVEEAQIEITQIQGTLLYMSPQKLIHCQQQKIDSFSQVTLSQLSQVAGFMHNPFKSDIYSLGLVLLRIILHNNDISTQVQIETIFFHNRQELLQNVIEKYEYYYFSEKVFQFDQKLYRIKNLLQLMLEEQENNRISTIDLALMMRIPILAPIQTPFCSFFPPQEIQLNSQSQQYQVTYSLRSLLYEGEYNKGQRMGQGKISKTKQNIFTKYKKSKKHQTIMEEDELDLELSHISIQRSFTPIIQVLYEGEWKCNLPNGMGKLNLQTNELNDEQGLQVETNFYYGLLHGKATILPYNEYKQYVLNISQCCCEPLILQRKYYKFIYDVNTDSILGYEQLSDITTIDLIQIEDIDNMVMIIENVLKTKWYHCQFQSYGQIKEIQLKNDFDTLRILFQSKERQKRKKEIQVEQKKKKQVFCCFYKEPNKVEEVFYNITTDEVETALIKVIFQHQLPFLIYLKLINCQFQPIALQRLELKNQMVIIQELNLYGSSITDQQMQSLLLSNWVISLKWLNLSNTMVGSQTIDALTRTECDLHRLYLQNCFQCSNLDDYITSGKASKLTHLDISSNNWVNHHFGKCLQTVYLPNLRELNVSECPNLLRCDFFKKVQLVNSVSCSEVVHYNQNFNFNNSLLKQVRNLETFGYASEKEFKENQCLTDETLKLLSKSIGLQSIESLNLNCSSISDRGIIEILKSQYLYSINKIDFSNTPIEGEALELIAQSQALCHLRKLVLRNCHSIDYVSMKNFVKSIKGAQLKVLYFNSNQLNSKQTIECLKQVSNLQKTDIYFKDLVDLPLLLRMTLTWVLGLIFMKQLRKIKIQFDGQPEDAFNHFLDEYKSIPIGEFTIIIKSKLLPDGLVQKLRQLKNIKIEANN